MKNTRFIRVFFASTFYLSLTTLAWGQKNEGTKPLKRVENKKDEEDTETVLDIDEGVLSGYGGVRWGTASIDGKWLPTAGLRGAWVFQKDISLGIDFTQLMGNYSPFSQSEWSGIEQNVSTAGLILEKNYHPTKILNVFSNVIIGRGFSDLRGDEKDNAIPSELKESRAYAFISPGFGLGVNFTKYTRGYVGASAMLPFAGQGSQLIKEEKLRGGYVYLGFNIGNF